MSGIRYCPTCLRAIDEGSYYAQQQSECADCQSKESCLERDDDGPSVEQVLADPAASSWIKQALESALPRDPVDAANDAEVLARLLDSRCRRILGGS
jgi:3'-phosphoadenosine 5'-phosphosulfate (PAPS) 3'-phosphatase